MLALNKVFAEVLRTKPYKIFHLILWNDMSRFGAPLLSVRDESLPLVLLEPKHRSRHPENYLFSLHQKKILDQSIQKVVYLILKTEALIISP